MRTCWSRGWGNLDRVDNHPTRLVSSLKDVLSRSVQASVWIYRSSCQSRLIERRVVHRTLRWIEWRLKRRCQLIYLYRFHRVLCSRFQGPSSHAYRRQWSSLYELLMRSLDRRAWVWSLAQWGSSPALCLSVRTVFLCAMRELHCTALRRYIL